MQARRILLFVLAVSLGAGQNFSESLTSKLQCTLYYSQVPAFSFGYCLTLAHQNYSSWPTCSQACCGSLASVSNSTVPSEADIQNCGEEKTAPNTGLIIELSSAFSAVVFLTVAGFIVYSLCIRQPEDDPQFDLPPHEEKQLTKSPHEPKWMEREIEKMEEADRIKLQASNERVCALCFDLAPTVEAHCMHSYHVNCAMKLIEEGNQCRLCEKWMGKYLRVHCPHCFVKYFVIKKVRLSQLQDVDLTCADCNLMPAESKQHLNQESATLSRMPSPTSQSNIPSSLF